MKNNLKVLLILLVSTIINLGYAKEKVNSEQHTLEHELYDLKNWSYNYESDQIFRSDFKEMDLSKITCKGIWRSQRNKYQRVSFKIDYLSPEDLGTDNPETFLYLPNEFFKKLLHPGQKIITKYIKFDGAMERNGLIGNIAKRIYHGKGFVQEIVYTNEKGLHSATDRRKSRKHEITFRLHEENPNSFFITIGSYRNDRFDIAEIDRTYSSNMTAICK